MENQSSGQGFFKPEEVIGMFGLQEGMSVADFGSGAGHFGILMAQRVGKDGKIWAFDIMESALEAIRGKATAAGLANLEAKRANLEVAGGTGLPDNSQDIVLMANILFQSQKKEDILKEGQRILKSGGRMIIIDWIKGTGGFGPPDELRTDKEVFQQIATGVGLALQSSMNAGKFHQIMIFSKS